MKDSLRAAPGLLVPGGGGGGDLSEDQELRLHLANDFCSKRDGQARAGEPTEDKQAGLGSWAPTSWILLPAGTPLSQAHLRSLVLCSSHPVAGVGWRIGGAQVGTGKRERTQMEQGIYLAMGSSSER